jgi:hypothetical protein
MRTARLDRAHPTEKAVGGASSSSPRPAGDFEREPPGGDAAESLTARTGGFLPSVANAHRVAAHLARAIVDDLGDVERWTSEVAARWVPGRSMSLTGLRDRMMCPRCGNRRVNLIFSSRHQSRRAPRSRKASQGMCNVYSLTKGQAAIRDLFSAKHDRTGNLPLFPAIFPN